jgi:hypothetical protein
LKGKNGIPFLPILIRYGNDFLFIKIKGFCMILALDKHGALYVFASTEDAERDLEAIDVQQDAFEFCDARGKRYSPTYTRPPKESRLGPFGVVDIGAFRLMADGGVDAGLPESFVVRAHHLEHSSVPAITSIVTLQEELQRRT